MGAEELLAACRAAPDDDDARLVWADSVGGERGELVVLQCDLARLPPAEGAERWRRVRELVEQHGRAWSGLDEIAQSCTWRRGFVERITVELETCVQHAAEIARAAPLVATIELTGARLSTWREDGGRQPRDAVEVVTELLARPELRAVRGLVFRNTVGQRFAEVQDEGRGDAIALLVAHSGRLAELRELGFIDCELGTDGVATIAEHGRALERLQLRESVTDRYSIYESVVPAPPLDAIRGLPLRALGLRTLAGDAIEHLPDSLVELEIDRAAPDVFAALAASPHARRLEQLRCVHGMIPAATFAAFTGLRPPRLDTITVELRGPRA